MNKTVFALTLALATTLAAGCNPVKVSEAGKRINMVTGNDVQNCTRIGTISNSVLDNVIGIPRNKNKVQSDLDKLARDQAVLLNANTLVRDSVQDGLGSYSAYNCP